MFGKRSKSHTNILCVESDENSRELIAAVLGLGGFTVDFAGTVAAGLQMARRQRYALILLEYYYSDGTGPQLCRLIRRYDKRTPILFYSGEAREKKIKAALAAGGLDYLIRPGDPYELLKSVKRYTEHFDER